MDLAPNGPNEFAGIRKKHFRARKVGERRQMIVAEFGIDHPPVVVDHHLLVQRRAKRLRDAAFDLAAALHRVGDPAGIGGLDALQDLDLAGALVHGDTEALDIEGDRTRRSGRSAAGFKRLALCLGRFSKLAEATGAACRTRPNRSQARMRRRPARPAPLQRL